MYSRRVESAGPWWPGMDEEPPASPAGKEASVSNTDAGDVMPSLRLRYRIGLALSGIPVAPLNRGGGACCVGSWGVTPSGDEPRFSTLLPSPLPATQLLKIQKSGLSSYLTLEIMPGCHCGETGVGLGGVSLSYLVDRREVLDHPAEPIAAAPRVIPVGPYTELQSR